MKLEDNTLYYGDCLEVMADWPDGCVDLIYLDPPFNSNTDYNILYGTELAGRRAQTLAFSDTWEWDEPARKRVRALRNATAHPAARVIRGLEMSLGESGMLAYISYMAERLVVMKRLLKATGSIYLHCDDNASHHLRALMDAVFTQGNFRNHIAWRRAIAHNDPRRFGRIQDHILFYANGENPTWNGQDIATPRSAEQILEDFPSEDERGRYRSSDLTGAGSSEGAPSSAAWRDYDVASRGRHWSPPRSGHYAAYIERHFIPGYRSLEGVHERLDALDAAGLITHPEEGFWPGLKRYAAAERGIPPQDIIMRPTGFTNYNVGRGEHLGYPTQKPVALLRKLILAASNEDELVLDPFCGCGTTIAAAHDLKRRWLGIDVSPFAIDLIVKRRFNGLQIHTRGIPTDMEGAARLAQEKPFDFEKWAVTRIPGMAPNTRQVGDKGIDGRGHFLNKGDNGRDNLVLAQVKGGKYKPGELREFTGALAQGALIDGERAQLGVFITLQALKGRQLRNARAAMAAAGELKLGATVYPRAQMWSIEEYFAGRKPQLPPMADPFSGKAIPAELQTRFF